MLSKPGLSKLFGRIRKERTCPYCRNVLMIGELVVRCASCETLQHNGCWYIHGKCSVYGCGSSRLTLSISPSLQLVVTSAAVLFPAIKGAFSGEFYWFSTLFPFVLGYLHLSAYRNPLRNFLTNIVDSLYADRESLLVRGYLFFGLWVAGIIYMLIGHANLTTMQK